MFVLTGTNGGLGSVVLRTLLDEHLVPPSSLRISTANPASVPATFLKTGIEVRQGNLYEPSTLESSYAGAEVLFLVSFPSMGEERYALHKNAIDAAKKVGVKHVIYTSLSFCYGAEGNESVAQVARAHLNTEAYLKESGMSWTILRIGSYQHLWNNYAGFLNLDAAKEGEVIEAVLPNDGREHWIDRTDLGIATARLIADWVCSSPRCLRRRRSDC
jgi:NAD(P)H dehydrogenase (quinone)